MAALFGPIGLVVNMNQAVNGNALGNPSYASQIQVAEGAGGQAAVIAQYNTLLAASNPATLATTIMNNLFITTAAGVPAASVTALNTAIAQLLATYPTAKGQVIANITSLLGNLEGDATWGPAAVAFNNQAAADYIYSNNTANANAGVPSAVTTYTLTTGVDTIPGNSANETVNGVIGATTTLNIFDSINGGGGVNTLNVAYTGTASTFDNTTIPTLTNIQVVNLSGLDGDAANTMNAAIAPSITTLGISSPIAAAGAGSFALTDALATLNTYNISSIARDDFDLTFTSKAEATSGTTDAITLNVTDVAGASPTSTTDGPVISFRAVSANQGIETVTVNATGTNRLENLIVDDGAGVESMATLNIAGTGSLRIDAALDFKSTSGTINASTNTGGVTLTATGAEATTFTGGAGNDRLNFAAGGFTNADVVTFGAGTNTLGLGDATYTDALYALVNTAAAQKLALTVGTNTTVDMSKLTGSIVVVDNDASAGAADNVIQKLAATDTVEITTAAATADVNITASVGFNTANIVLAGDSTDDVDVDTLTATGQSTINITSNGTSGATNSFTTFTNTTNAVITVTGAANLTLGTLGAAAAVNGAAFTGILTVTGANAASSFTGGSKADVFNLNTAAGGDVAVGGAGNDTFNVVSLTGTTAVELTGGTGADTYAFDDTVTVTATATINATAAESYATAGKFDTITYAEGINTDDLVVTLVTGVTSSTLSSATSAAFVVGTTTVTAGAFLWVSATGATTATAADGTLYQDSNSNGVIDATDFAFAVDLTSTADTVAITIVAGKATITIEGV